MTGPTGPFDFDSAEYVGDESDGVYVLAEQDERGWWCRCVVSAANFTEDLPTVGPFSSEDEALSHGLDRAREWCNECGVMPI